MASSEGTSVNLLKIFVGNLTFSANEEDIAGLFSQYGEIVGVNLRTDRTTGKKKGFGFVTFKTSSSSRQLPFLEPMGPCSKEEPSQ